MEELVKEELFTESELEMVNKVDRIVRIEYKKSKISLSSKKLNEFLKSSDILKSKGFKYMFLCKNGVLNDNNIEDINHEQEQIDLFVKILDEEVFNNKNFSYNNDKTLFSLRIYGDDFFIIIIKDIINIKSNYFRSEIENYFYKKNQFINNNDYYIIDLIKK